MWSATFNTLINGEHELLISLVHWYLLAVDVAATGVVGIGLLWEARPLTITHKAARAFVLWGVATEMVCSVALFTFDEGISTAQQAKILSTVAAEKAIVEQLKPRHFTPDGFNGFADAMRGKFTRPLTLYTIPDNEAGEFGLEVLEALQKANIKPIWVRLPNNLPSFPVPTTGITIIESDESQSGRTETDAFMKACSAGDLPGKVCGMSFRPVNTPGLSTPAIFVGLHPVPLDWIPAYDVPKTVKIPPPPWELK